MQSRLHAPLGRRMPSLAATSWMMAVCVGFLIGMTAAFQPIAAQETPPAFGFGDVPGGDPIADPVKVTADFQLTKDRTHGRVRVTAEIEPGWHVYSVTQSEGPLPTVIKLGKTDLVRLTGAFTPDQPPKPTQEDVYPGVVVEVHEERVTWSAPIEFVKPVEDPAAVVIPLEVEGQVCLQTCQLFSASPEAKYAGEYQESVVGTSEYKPDGRHGSLSGEVSSRVVGEEMVITWKLHAQPVAGWHIYAYAKKKKPGQISSPTLFYFQVPKEWAVSEPVPSEPPLRESTGLDADPVMFYHESPVTWTVELRAPLAAREKLDLLQGYVGFQFCSNSQCDLPSVVQFAADVSQHRDGPSTTVPLRFQEPAAFSYEKLNALVATKKEVGDEDRPAAGLRIEAIESDETLQNYPLASILFIAALGGFLLNFMPCVLPVIGLKIMAFVEQAGAKRGKVFWLNTWYAVGMLIVFLILATLISAKDLGLWEREFGWGQQSQSAIYQITVSAVIFVMALSFLGVWEIPVPGFVGTSKVAQYSDQGEGVTAALLKGVITTIVAIPCTAPAISTALAWSANKPPSVVFTVFTAMWFGMALPYFVIGLFPRLIGFLPKPGLWMETFKQFLGFLLLGTVVFFLSFLDAPLVVPTVAFLVALWMACWLIGKIPITAPPSRKWSMRVTALAVALAGGVFSYGYFDDVMQRRFERAVEIELASRGGELQPREVHGDTNELPWQRFSRERLEQALAEGKTVMVDFTADWCVNCKVTERLVLNTPEVKDIVTQRGIVPMTADWTKRDEEIGQMLDQLGGRQIPLIAIFPADNPGRPIVLRGGYPAVTQSAIIEKLKQAARAVEVDEARSDSTTPVATGVPEASG